MQKLTDNKERIAIALKKALASLEKIIPMVEQKKDCFSIIQQNLAIIGLLKNTNLLMLESYMDQHLGLMNKNKSSRRDLETIRTEVLKIVRTAQNK
ncbi:MAG: metal-sensing transcriptional repressor [Candidatus Moranbacteria bacterium]|nr:metal-sensing transcriptional repressor [Candidatus Moranbacteria bacterium]